jgi:hypothetical protein
MTCKSSRDGDLRRYAPLAMDAATFRSLGHRLVDQVAGLLDSVPLGPVTRDESPSAVRQALNLTGPLPESGMDPGLLLEEAARLLFAHSLFNGHPRFFGYITAPPAPIGILGDFLAAAVNPNVGAWTLSPAATEIESQTVQWIASLIGYPANCGGLLVSGGNMANFVCFLAARARKSQLECTRARRLCRFRSPASCVQLNGNAHVDSKGRRPRRPRYRIDPVGRHRFQITDGCLRVTQSNRSGYRRGRCAISRRRNRGIGQHRCGRSSAGNQRALQGVWPVVSRGWSLWWLCGSCSPGAR